MENNYIRQSRHLSDKTKEKISKALVGRTLTKSHIEGIKNGLRKYWSDDRNFPQDNHATIKDILL